MKKEIAPSISDKGQSSSELIGVKGWLLFLCMWLGLFAPLYNIGLLLVLQYRLEAVNPVDAELMRESGLGALLWSVALIRSAILFAAGAALYLKREAWVVPFALVCLWTAGPVLTVASAFAVDGEVAVQGLVRSIMIASAWSLYLFDSKRVRHTYNFRMTK
ncbi:MAG TPA: DUF2569 family protein [Sphingorhabdus lacus]|uniref:DUF2569 family protein n=1 Tax=Sphingorhabdus lacus TaxID=392610 RepID=UPI002C20716E|nr:DUF2569 family protein [Sphingorhabdus lacus]HPV68410.1 DUF2569 family protein [Sphingorhabdus lacus]